MTTPAGHLDDSIGRLGLTVLKSPPRTPTANTICERLIGTNRRECLDWLIPLSGSYLRSILKSRKTHYNRGPPHMSLGSVSLIRRPILHCLPMRIPVNRHI
ncbi:hypothetical protein BZM27_46420 [Paraburkholderia steynii]|uniref:Integrase catalytic domain-containing protein n=1 Tax=Paraburkholderia steynii TaxID=1245441 RepID=A0A4R0XCN7_9BURK|nr:hypothetical protein BZM27_46420 [Paraburkholderia steynii]